MKQKDSMKKVRVTLKHLQLHKPVNSFFLFFFFESDEIASQKTLVFIKNEATLAERKCEFTSL
jgi:hypothetical protein